ncbi:MAG: hypothetical protein H6835_12910 [Planctomycetes bacterium]|nr:hypothetical protein [Planctomycetota bacterium]
MHSPARWLPCAVAMFALVAASPAQVHYHQDGRPWSIKTQSGPDQDVPGWFYNLGITGLRVELVENAPTHLVVRYVLPDSPAAGKVHVGDHVIGAGGAVFATPHQNGYGEKVFGARGPIGDFAAALDAALQQGKKARLDVRVLRGDDEKDLRLDVGTVGAKHGGSFAATFPTDCKKSGHVLDTLLPWLVEQQRDDGSWGSPPHDVFAPLALLASGDQKHHKAVERCARFHARTTQAKDHDSLINWRYMAAGIVLAEYHLATGEKWVLPELEQVRDFLLHSQYTDPSQINPKSHESHPDAVPKKPGEAEGGWGHNPGFEGYGPIAMITGQGALVFALMERCGVDVPRERHDAAYAFLQRATGKNGYVWYEDESAGDQNWADPGRTGAAGIANWICPFDVAAHRAQALRHTACIGAHPESFPDTHGCPTMGMAYAALTAHLEPGAWRSLLDANRWWFVLSECPDGTFYYQPNRDNAGYGADSRLSASAVVAFILTMEKRSLCITGRDDAPAAPSTGPK